MLDLKYLCNFLKFGNKFSENLNLLNFTDQSSSYFPGFPTYAVVPGPDTHRVSYRPGKVLMTSHSQFFRNTGKELSNLIEICLILNKELF